MELRYPDDEPSVVTTPIQPLPVLPREQYSHPASSRIPAVTQPSLPRKRGRPPYPINAAGYRIPPAVQYRHAPKSAPIPGPSSERPSGNYYRTKAMEGGVGPRPAQRPTGKIFVPGFGARPLPPGLQPVAMLAVAGKSRLTCLSIGCENTVTVKGKRCLGCVRGSWMGMQEKHQAEREARVEAESQARVVALKEDKTCEARRAATAGKPGGTPQKRVTIRLKLTPVGKAGPSGEMIVDTDGRRIVVLGGKDESSGNRHDNVKKSVSEDTTDSRPSGWDSELSELTNSAGETDDEDSPPTSSLKIRIPGLAAASEASTRRSESMQQACPATESALTTDTCASVTIQSILKPPKPAKLSLASDTFIEPARFCTISRCRTPLPPLSEYRWKCCEACRNHYREYQRQRLGKIAAGAAHAALVQVGAVLGDPSANPEVTETSPLAYRAQMEQRLIREWDEGRRTPVALPSGKMTRERPRCAAMAGARQCAGVYCEHIIPPATEYEWDKCGLCRVREQRKLVKERKSQVVDAAEYPLTPYHVPGRCVHADCGVLVPADALPDTECQQCLWRKPLSEQKITTVQRDRPKKQLVHAPPEPPEPAKKRKRISPYPLYQCCQDLLQDFAVRFRDFIGAQSLYFIARTAKEAPQLPSQSMFDFSGEFSVVAPHMDVVSRRHLVEQAVHAVKDEIANVSGIEFDPTSWVSILGPPGGVVTRFACSHHVDMPISVRYSAGHPSDPTGHRTRTMQGELEVAVLPDDTHRRFPGEKTIVRFRLVD
ncbi:unnamed protein product [Mycena citricolor]|uniref:Uncharacterized protein n=1 Tax=Mycena citricolor TaxID=2018698 RepID=A0AAD2H1H3_9AGAR|nr:unnamed protein product [Mycena citricolor]